MTQQNNTTERFWITATLEKMGFEEIESQVWKYRHLKVLVLRDSVLQLLGVGGKITYYSPEDQIDLLAQVSEYLSNLNSVPNPEWLEVKHITDTVRENLLKLQTA